MAPPDAATAHYSAATLAAPEVIANPYPAYAALRDQSPVPGNTDQPLHTIQRKIVNKAFTRKRVADMRPWIERKAAELVARIPAGEEQEMVQTVCQELPASVMCEFLGTPGEDAPRYRKWTTAFMLTADMPPEERMASNMELGAYFLEKLQARSAALAAGEAPHGLMDALLLAEADGERLPFEDVLNMCITLMIAGSETSMYYFGNLVNSLVAYPDAVAKIRADRSLVRNFIEETLRLTGRPQRLFRIATRDVELGIHYCLWAPLAALEAECLVGAILDRFPRFEYGPTPVQAQTATLLTYRLTQLPIIFHEEA